MCSTASSTQNIHTDTTHYTDTATYQDTHRPHTRPSIVEDMAQVGNSSYKLTFLEGDALEIRFTDLFERNLYFGDVWQKAIDAGAVKAFPVWERKGFLVYIENEGLTDLF